MRHYTYAYFDIASRYMKNPATSTIPMSRGRVALQDLATLPRQYCIFLAVVTRALFFNSRMLYVFKCYIKIRSFPFTTPHTRLLAARGFDHGTENKRELGFLVAQFRPRSIRQHRICLLSAIKYQRSDVPASCYLALGTVNDDTLATKG